MSYLCSVSQIITTALVAFEAKQNSCQSRPFLFPGLVFTGESVVGVFVFCPPVGPATAKMTEIEHIVDGNGNYNMDSRGWKILCYFIYLSLVRQLPRDRHSRLTQVVCYPAMQEKKRDICCIMQTKP